MATETVVLRFAPDGYERSNASEGYTGSYGPVPEFPYTDYRTYCDLFYTIPDLSRYTVISTQWDVRIEWGGIIGSTGKGEWVFNGEVLIPDLSTNYDGSPRAIIDAPLLTPGAHTIAWKVTQNSTAGFWYPSPNSNPLSMYYTVSVLVTYPDGHGPIPPCKQAEVGEFTPTSGASIFLGPIAEDKAVVYESGGMIRLVSSAGNSASIAATFDGNTSISGPVYLSAYANGAVVYFTGSHE
jgi:hypothetical protein